jgi:phosphomannomutase
MNKIFKAYDVRGVYPEDINSEVAFRIGRALAVYLEVSSVCIGRDMRVSSEEIASGLIDGIRAEGVSVVDLGLTSTDMVYFATGRYGYGGGVMITASHNPGEWNGMKICKQNAIPISLESGLLDILNLTIGNSFTNKAEIGSYNKKNILDDWIDFAISFIDLPKIKTFKIAIDAGNGMAGMIMPALAEKMPQIDMIKLYFELDGTFPNHLASPIEPENTEDLVSLVKEKKCDLGLAFDGDADRVFLIDDEGERISGTIMTAMIAEGTLKDHKNATILYNAICGKIVPEVIESNGGKAIRTKVGHSLIKADMKKYGAVFAGEHSGHYYFKDNFNADSALIAVMIILKLLSDKKCKLSDLRKKYSKYVASGEINSKVDNIDQKLLELKNLFVDANSYDELDGLTFYYDNYWFNIRPSNTEPLLRLNVEALDFDILAKKSEQVLDLIRQ